MTENPRRVAVVGAGASGALTAAQLLRRAAQAGVPLDVRLIDRAPATGRGTAYATTADHHLLNVPAGRMSAFADEPDDFVHWLARRAPGVHTAADHVPRRLYGAYLGEVLATAEARAGTARLHRVDDRVVSARRAGPGMSLRLGTGRRLDADALVLALAAIPHDAASPPALLRRSPSYDAPHSDTQ
ncbi:FAD/NAD(P)-binding protein, partial [Kitasatospora purpeofusca]|uniref:FAD/NAD(P)-binding protein n=1 Tax=Kitasatospora purpeofusca TaxID=67352 RepID=UPI0035D5903D